MAAELQAKLAKGKADRKRRMERKDDEGDGGKRRATVNDEHDGSTDDDAGEDKDEVLTAFKEDVKIDAKDDEGAVGPSKQGRKGEAKRERQRAEEAVSAMDFGPKYMTPLEVEEILRRLWAAEVREDEGLRCGREEGNVAPSSLTTTSP